MAKKSLPVEKLTTAKAVPVKIINDTPQVAKSDEAREREYRARSALDDIEKAEKHKTDRDLMKDVKKLGREKVKNLKKIC